MIGLLKKARQDGEAVYFDKEHFGCPGGGYYMGFFESPRPKLEYFLSCGIPGEMEGERYVKTPELAKIFIASRIPKRAPAKYCVFKPIHQFRGKEQPDVVVFFARPPIFFPGFLPWRTTPWKAWRRSTRPSVQGAVPFSPTL
jgi:uncharacterized protein (DUF169 family)